jgi:hypothetical protein
LVGLVKSASNGHVEFGIKFNSINLFEKSPCGSNDKVSSNISGKFVINLPITF